MTIHSGTPPPVMIGYVTIMPCQAFPQEKNSDYTTASIIDLRNEFTVKLSDVNDKCVKLEDENVALKSENVLMKQQLDDSEIHCI